MDVDKLLSMSQYNPIFILSFDNVIKDLLSKRNKGEISNAEYRKAYEALHYKKTGDLSDATLTKAFSTYILLKNQGFYNLNFNEDQMKSITLAREVISRFYSWADISRHSLNNPFVLEYLKNLSLKVIKLLKTKEEELWDAYHELKMSSLYAVSRGVVSRTQMDSIAKVLLHAMSYEDQIIKEFQKSNAHHEMKEMNLFSTDSIEDIQMDLSEQGSILLYHYLTNRNTFEQVTKKYLSELNESLRNGKISETEFSRKRLVLNNYSYTLDTYSDIREYEPIITYYWCTANEKSLDRCLLYNSEQITKAVVFSREFSKFFTNEFIINELIIKKLSIDLSEFDNDYEVKREFFKTFVKNLNFLKDFHIISVSKYSEYLEEGKVKFS